MRPDSQLLKRSAVTGLYSGALLFVAMIFIVGASQPLKLVILTCIFIMFATIFSYLFSRLKDRYK